MFASIDGLAGMAKAIVCGHKASAPIIEPSEMNASADHIVRLLKDDKRLSASYANVFGDVARRQDPQHALANVGKALSAFQETLVRPPHIL